MMIEIYRAADPMQAALLHGLLEAEGIAIDPEPHGPGLG